MIVLASKSEIRAKLLFQSGISFEIIPTRIDEEAIKSDMVSKNAGYRDIADIIAEAKALRVSRRKASTLVLGCDQIAEMDGKLLSKANTEQELRDQLLWLRGKTHTLYSAAVVACDSVPLARFIGKASVTMRDYSNDFLDDYIARNWSYVSGSLGGYLMEGEGVQLIENYEGDYYSILGIPLFQVLSYLRVRQEIAS